MVLWRSGYAAVCKTAYTGSIPVGTSIFYVNVRFYAQKKLLFFDIIVEGEHDEQHKK